jgi:hypothetical protein
MTSLSMTRMDWQPGSRWFQAARMGWAFVTLLTLFLTFVGIPERYMQLISTDARALHNLGISQSGYTIYVISLTLLLILVHVLIAGMIFLRMRQDWMALLVAVALVTNGAATSLSVMYSPGTSHPVLHSLVNLVVYTGLVSCMVLLYLFPTGRFVPSWSRWLAVAWAVLMLPAILVPDSAFSLASWPPFAQVSILLLWSSLAIYVQGYRYTNVSSPLQRQQAKWGFFGLTAAVLGPFAYFVPFVIVPTLSAPAVSNLMYQRVGSSFFAFSMALRLGGLTVFTLAALLFPISFAIAILRYRLWDIDILINRALVYSILTGTLAVIYFAVVVLLQTVFRTFTGQSQSEIVTVLSTLVIASLAVPLQRRVQRSIDRRFYRQKYDAACTLSEFSASLRDEVDLSQLSGRLIDVVNDTMQPAQVSLWLRLPEDSRPPIADQLHNFP